MKTPKISIIIPVYNGEKTITQCLTSILAQNYPNYEIIVVDNGSTDRTKEIVSKHAVILLSEIQKGRGAARNTGERNAKGDIILMTDSDCIVPRDWISSMVAPLLKGYDCVQGSEKSIHRNFWAIQNELRAHKKLESNKIIGLIDTKNFAITKKVLKKIGYTNRLYISGNDTDLSFRLASNNVKLKIVKDTKVKHLHPNSFLPSMKKWFYRGVWCSVITRDHRGKLGNSDFKKRTGQTLSSFFKLPKWLSYISKYGFGWAYFSLVTGIAWRIGLIYGKLFK
jgi:O-antigen biosynthesis protein